MRLIYGLLWPRFARANMNRFGNGFGFRRSQTGPGIARSTRHAIIVAILTSLSVFEGISAETVGRSDTASLIDLKIETSRSQPTAGTGLGVIAEIKNLSDTNVYLRAKELTLVLPPELSGATNEITVIFPWYAQFPTEGVKDTNDIWNKSIVIRPGDSYKAFWVPAPETFKSGANFLVNIRYVFLSEMNFIFFTPGDYKISIVGKYWTDPSCPTNDYRTVTQSLTVRVTAPQFVILFGSALGGLIAYFILPHARPKLIRVRETDRAESKASRFWARAFKEFGGVLGAILLSAIIAILLSRLSETQFLIRITINDFWGAIAIGFAANYAGASVLDKMLRPKKGPNKTTGTESET